MMSVLAHRRSRRLGFDDMPSIGAEFWGASRSRRFFLREERRHTPRSVHVWRADLRFEGTGIVEQVGLAMVLATKSAKMVAGI